MFDDEAGASKLSSNLTVVEAGFIKSRQTTWADLFDGYDELYAITFSSSYRFVTKLVGKFRTCQIIFGNEQVLNGKIEEAIAFQKLMSDEILSSSDRTMCDMMSAGRLKCYVSRGTASHEKIYILHADDGRMRVITGSANASERAWNATQRENIVCFDDGQAYRHYKALFDDFVVSCADNVEFTARRIDPELEDGTDIPIIHTLQSQKVVVINDTSDKEAEQFSYEVQSLSKNLQPLMPKKEKNGKFILSVEGIIPFSRKYKDFSTARLVEQQKMPRLHISYTAKGVTFNDKPIDLKPSKDAVVAEINALLGYMKGFDSFAGDVDKNRRRYFLFANWFFASPFMPYLRAIGSSNDCDLRWFPVYAIIYGDSNGGKTEFVKLLTKMMCGKNIPPCRSDNFTQSIIDRYKQVGEGIPVIIDDLAKSQYSNHAANVYKFDAWGIKEGLINYPAVVVTTNEIPAIKHDISKRVFVTHIDISIDKSLTFDTYREIRKSIGRMKGALYAVYLDRMYDEVVAMADRMRQEDHAFPDVFKTSYDVLQSIFMDYIGEVPSWAADACDKEDYIGDKASSINAIQKIVNIYRYDYRSMEIMRRQNLLKIKAGDSDAYTLKYLFDELPPSLNAKISGHVLSMDLKETEKYFDFKFRKKWFSK